MQLPRTSKPCLGEFDTLMSISPVTKPGKTYVSEIIQLTAQPACFENVIWAGQQCCCNPYAQIGHGLQEEDEADALQSPPTCIDALQQLEHCRQMQAFAWERREACIEEILMRLRLHTGICNASELRLALLHADVQPVHQGLHCTAAWSCTQHGHSLVQHSIAPSAVLQRRTLLFKTSPHLSSRSSRA